MKKTIIISVAIALVLIAATINIYPSYDDWSTLSSPNFDAEWTKFFLPYGSVWRPFDALLGYIAAINGHALFPAMNHVLICLGHSASAVLVLFIGREIGLRRTFARAAAAFFLISPAMLGTVLSCDGVNQTYSQLWGLAAVLTYLRWKGRRRYVAWIVFVALAALSKDNGIAWAVVPPLMMIAADKDWRGMGCRPLMRIRMARRRLINGLLVGVVIAVVYFVVRSLLPSTEMYNAEYNTFSLAKKVRDIAALVGYTFTSADWIFLFYAPQRNIAAIVISFVLSAPLCAYVLFSRPRLYTVTRNAALLLSFLIVLSPHLLITMSLMNVYAGLGMVALLLASMAEGAVDTLPAARRVLPAAAMLFLLFALITDVHHLSMARTTADVGRRMAREVISHYDETADKPQKVYCLTLLQPDERKFSSFCVIPGDAFGGGAAVCHETNYRWPALTQPAYSTERDKAASMFAAMASIAAGRSDQVWVVRRDSVKILP